ncbi:hypothetical protein DSO57_1018396 [Entomophthora muscae]|uniref:Uncharacterized protein n=1 Tax=Entomophthora muscae TaxID=34485 RepID=A0ACC2U2P6_9FUNG|nr:hypothetical protein DSO57_1018396 [Entomophthora muscae]
MPVPSLTPPSPAGAPWYSWYPENGSAQITGYSKINENGTIDAQVLAEAQEVLANLQEEN